MLVNVSDFIKSLPRVVEPVMSWMHGEDMIKQNLSVNGQKPDPDKKYRVIQWVDINHERRFQKYLKKYGSQKARGQYVLFLKLHRDKLLKQYPEVFKVKKEEPKQEPVEETAKAEIPEVIMQDIRPKKRTRKPKA